MVGDNVIIQVLRIDHDKVRIGITAPPGVAVDREELRRAKEQQALNEAMEKAKTEP